MTHCRHCSAKLENIFLDLGFAPPSNSYLSHLNQSEKYYPLMLYVCKSCWLVQTIDYADRDEFFSEDYAYFSSVSKSFLKHAEDYTHMISKRLSLNEDSFVVEVASNDGYLLKNFISLGIPCIGIEPTISTAEASEKIGVHVIKDFFGEVLANDISKSGKKADLILGNNVYAHVPDINDFTKGLKALLKKDGSITLEFPHLMQLLKYSQFDTVYHEHYSYLSLTTVISIFDAHELKVYDVEELSTHGGSLRIYGCHTNDPRKISPNVSNILNKESDLGMQCIDTYESFQVQADTIKNNLLTFLIDQKNKGNSVSAYGAAAKGCTLLNYAGIKQDLIHSVFDAAPSKQNKFLPGSHIPILHPDEIKRIKPDILLVLPWNIKDEIIQQNDFIREWGGKFVVAVPDIKVLA